MSLEKKTDRKKSFQRRGTILCFHELWGQNSMVKIHHFWKPDGGSAFLWNFGDALEKLPRFEKSLPRFWEKVPRFWTNLQCFYGNVGSWNLVGRIWGQVQGERRNRARHWGQKRTASKEEVSPFQAFQASQKRCDARFLLKNVRNLVANFWSIVSYEEIGEGCECKKCKTPFSRAHAYAREKGV